MLIGVPKEVKTHEYRVGLVPGSVRELAHHGHEVVVESGGRRRNRLRRPGVSIGRRADPDARAAEVFAAAELIVKVKEPQPQEVALLHRGPDPVHLSAPRRGQGADRRA